MKPTWIAAVFAAVAPASVEGTVSTFSKTGCFTKQSSKSTNKVPTSTKSYTLTFKPKVTVVTTSTKTIVPASTTVITVSTSTSTATEILTQETDTFTATITNTETDSTTTTLISTEFATSNVVVTSTETLAMPASAGFTPLASQLAAQGYNAGTMKKRSAAKRITQAVDDDESELERRASPLVLKPKGLAKQYPVAVSCYRFVQVISTSTVVSTAKTTKTVTATPGTITVTSTTVEPTTTTSVPIDASTTLTVYTSTTITETATAISTTTSTLTSTSVTFAPMATYYPGCGSDNLVSSINGVGINGAYIAEAYSNTGFSTTATAQDCCVSCLLSETCGVSYFYPAANYCYALNTANTCSPTNAVVQISTGSQEYVVSNGYCGRAVYSGL